MKNEDVRNLASATRRKAAKIAKAAKPGEPAKPGPVAPRKPKAQVIRLVSKPARPKIKISDTLLQKVKASRHRDPDEALARLRGLVTPAAPAPGVLPKGSKVAMDEALPADLLGWAGNGFIQGGWFDGLTFLGYPILAEMLQRAEYRKACERMSEELTRKWIKLISTDENDQGDKADLIKEVDDFLKDIKLRDAAQKAAFLDGGMGRAHWYLDTDDTDDPNELIKPLGDGRDETSAAKVNPKHPLKRIQVLDPTWTYPSQYNSRNPLKPDWMRPSTWYSMGTEVHSSRLLTFVGREVPDLFKPAFMFGGLSLTQMMKPFVENWTSVRRHVARVVANFSKNGIKTDLQQTLAPADGVTSDGADLIRRLELYTATSDNNGLLVLDKENEEFFQFNTPLGTLDQLMSQFLEQVLLPAGMPIIVYLGLTPHGLNASSEGEIQSWESWVAAYQPHFFQDYIQRVIDFAQLSLRGKVDKSLTYEWVPLRSMTEQELADLKKAEADRDGVYVDRGILDPIEVRERLAKDPTSGYSNIDPDDVPEPPEPEPDDPNDGGGGGGERSLHPAESENRDADARGANDAGWEESKHPRVSSGSKGGQFTSGSGGEMLQENRS